MLKQCNKGNISCGEWKPLSEFEIRADTGKHRNQCKDCRNKYKDTYYSNETNKQNKLENDRLYYQNNKEEIKEYQKEYRKNNFDLVTSRQKQYVLDHKEDIRIKKKQYNQEHKEEIKIKKVKYQEEHKKEIAERHQQYYEDHKEEIKLRVKKYQEEHKEEIKEYQKIWRQDNKEEIKEIKKNWLINNKEAVKQSRREKEKHKWVNDINFKLRKTVSLLIRITLKSNNGDKFGKSILDFLPYSIEELKHHIENQFLVQENLDTNSKPWMTWNNHGIYDANIWNDNDSSTWTWQLDHIRPHSLFKYATMDCQEFQDCWALSNLRPLSANQNWLDGVFRTRHI